MAKKSSYDIDIVSQRRPRLKRLLQGAFRRVAWAAAIVVILLGARAAPAQTTLNATYTTTPWDNSSAIATGGGLTVDLALGFEYLILGGGGGGGGNIGGGGGAGGLLTNVGGAGRGQTPGNYAVGVGTGGTGGNTTARGANGGSSSIFGLTANGGGGGGSYNSIDGNAAFQQNGSAGGSGGGGSAYNNSTLGQGGTASQGNAGGTGVNTVSNGYRGGGGGGFGSAGASTSGTLTGTGGSGTTSMITGTLLTLAGGGGGGSTAGSTAGTGGSGVGGNGAAGLATASNGQANTGGGGGGGGYAGGSAVIGGSGGSGLVVVRYQSDTRLASGGSSSGTSGAWQFEQFTGSGTLALSYSAANLLATQSGTISGAGGFTYSSAGTLNLSAANTFTGNTRVAAGTLNLTNVNALQHSTLDMDAADAGAIGFGVNGTQTYGIGGLRGSRDLDVGSNSLSVGANGTGTTYSGRLTGSGGLVKAGAGALTLSGSSSFSGGTTISAGSILAGDDDALGTGTLTFAAGGGTLGATGNRSLTNAISLAASGTIAAVNSNILLSGPIGGAGGLTKTGTGTVTISGSNSYSGGTTLAGGPGSHGILRAASNWAFGTGTVTVNGTSAGEGNTLDVNGATLSNAVALQSTNSGVNDTGALQNTDTSVAAVLNGDVSIGGQNYVGGDGDIVLNGIVSGGANNVYSLFKQGAGTWTFANTANTFDGFYYQIGGTTEVASLANAGEASSLGQVSAAQNKFSFGFNGAGGGSLRFIGAVASASDRQFLLSGATAGASNVIDADGSTTAATLTLSGSLSATRAAAYTAVLTGSNTGVNTFAGVIGDGTAGGSVALVKDGSTTWSLTNANTYTGLTSIADGTLKVGDGGSTGTLGSSGAIVAAGGTLAFDRSDGGLVVTNVISGSGTVMQLGSGITSLAGANTYSGATEIAAGTLRVGNGSTSGTLGTGAISIASGGRLAFNRSDAVTISNAISGSGSVVKLASNALTLSGSSSYSGGTQLQAGTLIVGGDQALGTGALTFFSPGATLQTTRSLANDMVVDAAGTLSAGGNNVALSGNFAGAGTLTKTGTGTLTLSGTASTFTGNLVISGGVGANSIVRAGSAAAFGTGTVTIQGSGGNTGSTFDLNGMSLDNALVVGLGNSGVNNSGALQNTNTASRAVLNGAVSLGGEVYVGGAGDITFNGVISGGVNPANPYSIYKDGAGTWTYANTANSFDGYYYQVGGTTEVAKLANLGESSSLGQATTAERNKVSFGFNGSGGGTLRFIGSTASTSDRTFVLAGDTAASSNVIEAGGTSSAATLTLTGNLSATRAGSYAATLGGSNGGVNEFRGAISNGSGTVSVVKEGATTWSLTGTSTYTGATSINAGVLALGSSGALGTSGTISFGGGTLRFSAGNTTDYSSRFSTSAGQQYSIDTGGQIVSLGSSLTSEGGSLTKLGMGRLELTAVSTYSGTTDVLAGELKVNGVLANSSVTTAAATTLSGSGSVGGNVSIAGLHSPGNSPGIQSIGGDLTYTGGASSVLWELTANSADLAGRGVVFDGIDVAGNLSFGSATALALSFDGPGSTVNWNDAFWTTVLSGTSGWLLYEVAGTTTGVENLALSGTAWLDAFGNSFTTVRPESTFALAQIGSDVYLTVVAVPEPSTIVLVGIGTGLLAASTRRRRQ